MLPTFALSAIAAVLLTVSTSQAATVVFDGPSNFKGTGNGVIAGVLSLQAKPVDSGHETGFTGLDGSALTFSASDSQNKTGNGNATYQARSVTELIGLGMTDFNTFLQNF